MIIFKSFCQSSLTSALSCPCPRCITTQEVNTCWGFCSSPWLLRYGFVYLQFSSKPVHAAEPGPASSLHYLHSDTRLYRSRLKLLSLLNSSSSTVASHLNKLRMDFCSSQGYPIISRYSRKYPPEYIFESHLKFCLLWL